MAQSPAAGPARDADGQAWGSINPPDAIESTMSLNPDVLEYLAGRAELSPERVLRIYEAGAPWPLISHTIQHRVQLYASMFGVSIEQATTAIEAWCQQEEQRIAGLLQRAQESMGEPWFEQTLCDLASYPALQQMIDYSEGIALLAGEELASVFAVHLAVLGYANEHPEWNPVTSIT